MFYPNGMTKKDLIHVGERRDPCEDCPDDCGHEDMEFDEPEPDEE